MSGKLHVVGYFIFAGRSRIPGKRAMPVSWLTHTACANIMANKAFIEKAALDKLTLQKDRPCKSIPTGANIYGSAGRKNAVVVSERAVDDRRAAFHKVIAVDVNAAAHVVVVGFVSIGEAVFNNKSVEDCSCADAIEPYYMVGIIGVNAGTTHIAAENGGIGRPVALVERGLCAGKAAVQLDVFIDKKGFKPVV